MARNEINTKGFDRIYSEANGIAHYIGWDYSKGKLGYFNEDGTYTKGLRTIDGITYGFDQNGKIFNRQYKKFGNQWYYFNKYGEASKHSGKFATGWVGDRYYFSDGKPAEGLQKIGGVTYIFDELTKETMTNTTKVINFNRYKLDSYGRATLIGKIDTRQAVKGTRGLLSLDFLSILIGKLLTLPREILDGLIEDFRMEHFQDMAADQLPWPWSYQESFIEMTSTQLIQP